MKNINLDSVAKKALSDTIIKIGRDASLWSRPAESKEETVRHTRGHVFLKQSKNNVTHGSFTRRINSLFEYLNVQTIKQCNDNRGIGAAKMSSTFQTVNRADRHARMTALKIFC